MKYILVLIFLGINISFAQDLVDPLAKDKESYFKLLSTKYVLIPHRGTYLLPIVYNTRPHEDLYSEIKKSANGDHGDFYKKEELEFQISFMIPIQRKVLGTNFDFNVAYTHHAWWQLYNKAYSRPFRETNYMPEMFLRYVDPSTSRFGGFDLMAADFGFIHQSNGQIQILSRSWNRVYARAFFQNHGFQIFTTAWYRIPETVKDDENRDIYRYMGYGELEIAKSFGGHTVNLKTPIGSRHLSVDFKYSYPWKDNLRWYASVQTGYGHSLIEYNRSTQRFGVGFVLDSFIDRSIQ
ncbi:phospholipase A [Bacteriovorax sp. PP10]|uniref:Phosphatidylcholine 1-acylhydrolase n=1 Tax=Bacteriovorax antarcticus TaxID=3088717 RepID=A0ABU5W1B1_9BACT|nr:phospholipase A [Bacteriovorax sp. PP10]MEA9358418.1 phospholipase A [Bacteriovorax sp. PP10]